MTNHAWPQNIYVTLPGATKEFGTLAVLRIQAQRERDADWRRRLRDADALVTAALIDQTNDAAAALVDSGITCRVVDKERRLGQGFGLSEAAFAALQQCVSWV